MVDQIARRIPGGRGGGMMPIPMGMGGGADGEGEGGEGGDEGAAGGDAATAAAAGGAGGEAAAEGKGIVLCFFLFSSLFFCGFAFSLRSIDASAIGLVRPVFTHGPESSRGSKMSITVLVRGYCMNGSGGGYKPVPPEHN